MNRNEQIEEMSWIITFKAFEQAHLENGDDYLSDIVATELYDKGYCKASEVAREIFAEIEEKVKASIVIYLEEMNKEHIKDTPLYDRCSGSVFAFKNMEDFLAQIKKKYMEVDENA